LGAVGKGEVGGGKKGGRRGGGGVGVWGKMGQEVKANDGFDRHKRG